MAVKIIIMSVISILFVGCSFVSKNNSEKREIASERGKRVGNGGGACVCRDNGNITFAELLDFSEAFSKHKIILKHDERDHEIQLTEALNRLSFNEFFYNEVKANLAVLKNITEFSEKNETLTNDFESRVCESDEKLINKNCEYEQLAVYNDSANYLKFSQEIFEKLNSQNIAGIKMHEAIYKTLRVLSGDTESTSEFTKEIVANLFAKDFDKEKVKNLIESHKIFEITGSVSRESMTVCRTNGSWCKTVNIGDSNEYYGDRFLLINGSNKISSMLNCPAVYSADIESKKPWPIRHLYLNTIAYGFITLEGKVLGPDYKYVHFDCSEGFYAVSTHDLYGEKYYFIDGHGKKIGPYDKILSNFQNDRAAVLIKNKVGFINHDGLLVIDPIFDGLVQPFDQAGFATVLVFGTKKAVINKKGVILKYLE